MIFNIQKCSIHDGEGLRTLVFFKGCPLKCPWCSNPESQSYQKDIMETMNRCIGCGACRNICPTGAIGKNYIIERNLCAHCMQCTDVCYAEAKRVAGRDITTEDLYKEIEKDKPFYQIYGGGVTFSGGEPLTHPNDMGAIAKVCHDSGINVCLESCGFGSFEIFKKDLPYIDSMFMDIKIFDPVKHKEIIGADNAVILDNIRRIAEYGIPITIRTPIVPGYTDDDENIRDIAEFIRTLPNVKDYELMRYHNFGMSKYNALGRAYALREIEPPSDERMNELVRTANSILTEADKECFWTNNNERKVIK